MYILFYVRGDVYRNYHRFQINYSILLTNNVYYCGYLILWAIYFVFPTDAMYYFIVNYYGSFLQVVLKYWLSYITLSVYFGSGYANLPINPPQFC